MISVSSKTTTEEKCFIHCKDVIGNRYSEYHWELQQNVISYLPLYKACYIKGCVLAEKNFHLLILSKVQMKLRV